MIFAELCQRIVRAESRDRALRIIAEGMNAGPDGVILGCTELGLLLDPVSLPCPAFGSTAIHTEAAIAFALEPRAAASPLSVPEFHDEDVGRQA